jgi:hypothetical protein
MTDKRKKEWVPYIMQRDKGAKFRLLSSSLPTEEVEKIKKFMEMVMEDNGIAEGSDEYNIIMGRCIHQERLVSKIFMILRVFESLVTDDEEIMYRELTPERYAVYTSNVVDIVAHPEEGAKDRHERYRRKMLAGGWKFGVKSDVKNKVSALLVPYESLDKQLRIFNLFFEMIVRLVFKMKIYEGIYEEQ